MGIIEPDFSDDAERAGDAPTGVRSVSALPSLFTPFPSPKSKKAMETDNAHPAPCPAAPSPREPLDRLNSCSVPRPAKNRTTCCFARFPIQ